MFNQINSVDAAIAPLLKALKDLNTVATAKSRQIDQNDVKIARLQGESVAAKVEHTRANRIIQSLETIVDPKEGVSYASN